MPVPRSDLLTRKIRYKKGIGMISLTNTFCDVDDFCNLYKVHRGYAILSEQNVTKFLTELRSMGKGQWDGFLV